MYLVSSSRTPVVRVFAGALLATAALVVPSAASGVETDVVTEARIIDVQLPLQTTATPAPAPKPKKVVANFTARSLAAIRATRSASLFRWGTPAYAKWYAKSHIARKYEWGTNQFTCLVSLWNRESHWGFRSTNTGGRTYGIPQTNKRTIVAFGTTFAAYMKTPELQVQVGSKYINYRYGSPCAALAHSHRVGWY